MLKEKKSYCNRFSRGNCWMKSSRDCNQVPTFAATFRCLHLKSMVVSSKRHYAVGIPRTLDPIPKYLDTCVYNSDFSPNNGIKFYAVLALVFVHYTIIQKQKYFANTASLLQIKNRNFNLKNQLFEDSYHYT